MAGWSKNNRAHACLWFALRVLDELDTDFRSAGELLVRDLTGWNALDSEAARRRRAQTLAIHLDNMFRMIYRAVYEDGIDRVTAVDALFAGLTSGETPLPVLGAIADASYRFLGEVDDA